MKNKSRVYSLSVVILAVLLSALRTVCLLTAYNSDVGYLDSTPLVLVTRGLYIIGALWCFAIPFLPQKAERLSSIGSVPHIIFSNIAGSLSLFSGICIFINSLTSADRAVPGNTILPLFIGIFAALASIFFFSENPRLPKLRAAHASCGFLVLAFLFCLLFHIYFDMYVAINSPLKIALQLSILSALLFVLHEIRTAIGRPFSRIGTLSRFLCVLFCLPTAISHLILSSTEKLSYLAKDIISPFFSLSLLAIGIFAVSQLIFGKNTETIEKKSEKPLDKQEEA